MQSWANVSLLWLKCCSWITSSTKSRHQARPSIMQVEKDWTQHTCVAELRSCLHLAQCLASSCMNMPPQQLTWHKCKQECIMEWSWLWACFTGSDARPDSCTSSSFARSKAPSRVVTEAWDAFPHGTGAIHLQQGKPVALVAENCSKQNQDRLWLSKSFWNDSCLVVWRCYLLDAKHDFTIVTDHLCTYFNA